jgi:hypothetical protein
MSNRVRRGLMRTDRGGSSVRRLADGATASFLHTMVRWNCTLPAANGGEMPEFATVSLKEAQLRTIPGRQGRYMNEYVDYIQQVASGQAGRLHVLEQENPLTIRRRLVTAAKAMNIPLTIKRSGNELYFWREDGEAEQPRSRRGRRPRTGSPGSLTPSDLLISETEAAVQERTQEETTAPDQPFSASEEVDHEAALEESPELGQTDQVVTDAMRRVDPE